MITHLHVKSGDDCLNGIAVIGQTIFLENWLWRPSCFSEIAKNQYQPSYWYPIRWRYLRKFFLKWSDKVSCGRLTPRGNTNKNYIHVPSPGDIKIHKLFLPVLLLYMDDLFFQDSVRDAVRLPMYTQRQMIAMKRLLKICPKKSSGKFRVIFRKLSIYR